MSKDKTEAKPDTPASAGTPEPTPKQPRLTYTGQTEGAIPLPGYDAVQVHAGSRITPQDADHTAALLATGHFRAPEPKETA